MLQSMAHNGAQTVHVGAGHRDIWETETGMKVVELCQKSFGGLAPQGYAEARAGLQLTLVSRWGKVSRLFISTTSRPFDIPKTGKIAIKVINPLWR